MDETKVTSRPKELVIESIDSEIFEIFDPEQHLWMVGGSNTKQIQSTAEPTVTDINVIWDSDNS